MEPERGQNGNGPGPNGPNGTSPATRASSRRRRASTPSPPSVGATDVVELDNPSGRPAEPQRSGPSVERTDLRGDAGAPAGLRHQPVVHPFRRRRPQLAPGPLGLGGAADLRRRREGRRPAGRPRLGRSRQGSLVRETRTPVTRLVCRPPGRPGGEPAPHGHVGAEHGDHRECVAPAAPREPEQSRRLDAPDQEPDHIRPDHERPSDGGHQRPERRVEERRADARPRS